LAKAGNHLRKSGALRRKVILNCAAKHVTTGGIVDDSMGKEGGLQDAIPIIRLGIKNSAAFAEAAKENQT